MQPAARSGQTAALLCLNAERGWGPGRMTKELKRTCRKGKQRRKQKEAKNKRKRAIYFHFKAATPRVSTNSTTRPFASHSLSVCCFFSPFPFVVFVLFLKSLLSLACPRLVRPSSRRFPSSWQAVVQHFPLHCSATDSRALFFIVFVLCLSPDQPDQPANPAQLLNCSVTSPAHPSSHIFFFTSQETHPLSHQNTDLDPGRATLPSCPIVWRCLGRAALVGSLFLFISFLLLSGGAIIEQNCIVVPRLFAMEHKSAYFWTEMTGCPGAIRKYTS